MSEIARESQKVLEGHWGVKFGVIPEAFLTYLGKHQIKINKTDIDFLHAAALKEGYKTKTIADLRKLAETNLFYFAKYVLGNLDFTNTPIEGFGVKSTHGDICDFYIKKDKSKPLADQDPRWKQRLLLYPRGSFKSTANICDAIQWIINFPNIRILFLTSTRKLGVTLLDKIKGMLMVKTHVPTYMNQLFPEFCSLEKDLEGADSYYCPQRTSTGGEPTILASSVESALSGLHWDLMKCSDIISNENSGTEDQLSKATKNFYLNKKMLMQYGYIDLDGTRYHDLDTYGDILEKNEKTPEDERRLKVICEPSWKPKPGFEGKPITELEKDQVYLLFDHPDFLSYANLRADYRLDEVVHEGQMQQNPRPQTTTLFTRDLLVKRTVPFSALPFNGPVSITWDFAFKPTKGNDYTAGVVGIYNDKGQLFIVDLVFGRFKPADLAREFVALAKKWSPVSVIGVEDVAGSRYIEAALNMEAKLQGLPNLRIDWFTPEMSKGAKHTRMAALHPWLTNEQLFFSFNLPYLDKLYQQFELCLGSHHHEDIPDCVGHQLRYAPRIQNMMLTKDISTWSYEKAAYNLMYEEGTDAFGRVNEGTPQSIMVPVAPESIEAETPNGLPNVLGAGLFG